jgi:peptidoglycan/xylan/chitin deacetylase (PgdA/CDA1 family)
LIGLLWSDGSGDFIMKKDSLPLTKLPDLLLARLYLKFFHEKNALLIFAFHLLFRDKEEMSSNLVDPRLGITTEHFYKFVEYYLNHGYTFISPNEILEGLDHTRKYIMITFDDGYSNNRYALPILQKYNVPAVFFIITNNIQYNKCFWWDVLYRERIKQGASLRTIWREGDRLKWNTSTEIERYLTTNFGDQALHPLGEIDRPLTVAELKQLSNEKQVCIGNHTRDHAILTNYNAAEIQSQIGDAQDFLYEVTGKSPEIISYPDGYYSNKVIRVTSNAGFKLGVITDKKKNYFPFDGHGDISLRLGRFDLGGSNEPLKLCEIYRSDVSLYIIIWNFLHQRYRKS